MSPAQPTSPPVETRAITVYLRPDTTRGEIIDRVERYVATGFNFIILKVFLGGQTMFPSEVAAEALGLSERQRRRLADPTAALLEVARMHGLPVYAGIELLEHCSLPGATNPLLDSHADWYIPTNWAPAVQLREHDREHAPPEEPLAESEWMSPIHPEARRFLGSLLVETLQSYPFEGLYLDHIGLPAATDDAFLKTRDTQTLLRRGGDLGEFDLRPEEGPAPDHNTWNTWFRKQLVELTYYLRQRLYKVRPHLIMMMEARRLQAVEDDQTPSEPPAGTDPATPDRLEMHWREALDQVVEMLSPRYDISGKHRLETMTADFALVGQEAPLLPVLNLRTADLDILPFEQIRRSSALGFLIDAGRPLLEKHWKFFQRLFEGPATASHTNPDQAVESIAQHTASLLPEDSDVSALLRDMLRLLEEAEDFAAATKTRQSVIRNLQGLIDMAGRNDIALPPDPARWQVVRNLGLLIRLLAMVHSRGQMLRATPYFS